MYFHTFQPEDMPNLCLIFNECQPNMLINFMVINFKVHLRGSKV